MLDSAEPVQDDPERETPEPSRPAPGRNSRLARNTLVYGGGIIARRIASFVMLPVYTTYLTPADYGVMELLQLTVDLTVILVSAGTTAGVLRFFFKAEHERDRNAVVVSAFVLLVGLNLIGTIVLLLGAEPVSSIVLRGSGAPGLVRIVALDLVVQSLSTVPLILMQARGRAMLYSAVSLVTLVVQLGLNILLVVWLRRGVAGVLWSTLITHTLGGVFLTAWMLRETGWRTSGAAMRDLRRFAIPYQITTAGTFILTFGDRFVIQAVRDTGEVGIYSLAYRFGFLLGSVALTPFMTAWDPERFSAAKLDRSERDHLYQRGFRYLNLIVVSTAVGMSLFVSPLLTIMAAPAFHPAAVLVPVIVLAYLIQGWTDVVRFGIDVSEQARFVTYATWGAAAATILGYVILIPRYGGFGAATATLLGFVVRFALVLAFAQRVWPVTYRWRPIVLLLGWGCLVTALYHTVGPEALGTQLLTATVLGAVFAVVAYAIGVSPEERSSIRARILGALRDYRAIQPS